jgi:hypothetical protein
VKFEIYGSFYMVYYISAMPLRSQRPLHVKEMPVISINRLGDTKRIIRKMGGEAEEEERHKESLTKNKPTKLSY